MLWRLYMSFVRFVTKAFKGFKYKLALQSLRGCRDPIKVLNLFYGANRADLGGYNLISCIESSDSNGIGFLALNEQSIRSSELRDYISLRARVVESGAGTLVDVAEAVSRLDCPNKYRRKLNFEVVNKALPSSSAEEMLQVLDWMVELNGISEHQRVKIISRLAGQVDREVFSKWYSKLSLGLGERARLKGKMYADEVLGRNEYSKLDEAFCGLNTNLSSFYRDKLRDGYRAISPERNYIDARYSEKKTAELRRLILSKLAAREPYAYMRLGDGEAYAFACDGRLVNELGLDRQECHWWGEKLPKDLRNSLIHDFHRALPEADILGVPTVIRLIRDFNLKVVESYGVNSLISRLLAVMEGVKPLISSKLVVEDRSNLFVFDGEFLADLCEKADKVVILSGLTEEAMRGCIKSEKAVYMPIPTHKNMRGDELACSDEAILPFVYKDYLSEIRAHAGPGVLFLISAGFIGKLFVAEARRGGAVVVDVGQLMFSIAKKSRSAEVGHAYN